MTSHIYRLFIEEQFQYIVSQLYVRSFYFISQLEPRILEFLSNNSFLQLFRNKTLLSSDQAIRTRNEANGERNLTTGSVRYIDATVVL